MTNAIRFAAACIAISIATAGGVQAGYVAEFEPNDSLVAGQNVDIHFSYGADADIGRSDQSGTVKAYPHASILGTGNDTFDYFSFTVGAGKRGIFDIDYGWDYGGHVNTMFALYRADGRVERSATSSSSTSNGGGGSNSINDPYMEHLFETTGVYTIGVGEFGAAASGGALPGLRGDQYTVPQGATYTLHISIEDHALTGTTPVPEPTTLVLCGVGGIGMAIGAARRRRAARKPLADNL